MKSFFNKIIIVFFAFYFTFMIGCKGDAGPIGPAGSNGNNGNDGNSDKQIQLLFGGDFGTDLSQWLISPYSTYNLIKFNKQYYVGVDSIVFTCSLKNDDPTNKVYAELFNLTDSLSISNSQIEANKVNYDYIDSKNIYNSLPNKEITLAIRIRTEKNGVWVSTGKTSFLFLYRK